MGHKQTSPGNRQKHKPRQQPGGSQGAGGEGVARSLGSADESCHTGDGRTTRSYCTARGGYVQYLVINYSGNESEKEYL